MVAGAPSLNPRGRPKSGASLAEAVRSRFPVDRIVSLIEDLAEHGEPDSVRLAAAQMLAERGHGKVTDRLEVGRAEPDEPEVDLSLLSDDQIRELIALEDRRTALLAGAGARALPPMVDVVEARDEPREVEHRINAPLADE